MKTSYYNVFFPFEDEYVLFNTLGGAIFVVDSEIKGYLEKNEIASLSEEYKELFTDNGIIVEDSLNEQDAYKMMYEMSKYNSVSTALHVITTYDCNLACVYCYEGKGELEHKAMDEKTARCAIQFIKNQTKNNNSKVLGIELFGGEPLLNMPINLLVAKELSSWCEENGVRFSINAITNGTLSTAQNVDDLAAYTCSFLVTLDGPKEIHDQRRVLKDGTGTFDTIIEGLHRVHDAHLRIMIRINVDETNRNHIVPLFGFLKEEGLNNAVISIKPVFNTSAACLSYNFCMPDTETLQVVNDLYIKAREMNFGLEDPLRPSPQGACNAQKISYFTIDPYLRLFKCAILPPYEKNAVGKVRIEDAHPVFNHVNVDFLSRDPMVIEPCKTCKFVPMCRGGCPVEIYDIKGTTHSNVCRKSGYEETLKINLTNFAKKEL